MYFKGMSTAMVRGWVLLLLGFAQGSLAVEFDDVTDAAGLGNSFTETFGASWGDFNGDLYPDVFISNHRNPGQLFLNNGAGSFSDISTATDASNVFSTSTQDAHGAAWADFDNDGDQDLAMTISALQTRVMVNDNGVLTDQAAALGIQLLHNNGSRMPLFFDQNNDGLLDLKVVGLRETLTDQTVFQQQTNGTFTLLSGSAGLHCLDTQWAQYDNITASDTFELLCGSRVTFPDEAYELNMGIGSPVTLLDTVTAKDAVLADFNGDQFVDILNLTGSTRPNEFVRVNANRLEWQVVINGNGTRTLTFNSAGSLEMDVDTESWNLFNTGGSLADVYIGSGGIHPTSGALNLDPLNTANQGIQAPAGRSGLFIGYDNATQQWTAIVSASSMFSYAYFVVQSDQPMSGESLNGVPGGDAPSIPRLLINNAGAGLTDMTFGSGFVAEWCITGVAGDFDNDMDQDVYLACRGGAQNVENVYYENVGNGVFVKQTNTGAEGEVGPALFDQAGTGESVIVADFDIDGHLDLFVTNGLNMRPAGTGGSKKLFRNLGNQNNWLELDLQGVASNRDGVGAKVRVTAGGITQYRSQNGGYHRWSQNHQRIHFGLAANTTADITVEWPSGEVDNFTGIAANGLYRIEEAGALVSLMGGGQSMDSDNDGLSDADEINIYGTDPLNPDSDGGGVDDGAEVAANTDPNNAADDQLFALACGEPNFQSSVQRGTLLWRDCDGSGVWHLRVVGGGTPVRLDFAGEIRVDGGLTSLTGVSIESTDTLNESDPDALVYELKVFNNGLDGFDFTVPANACFTPIGPLNLPVYLGSGMTPLGSSDLNLTTGGGCNEFVDSDGDGLSDDDELNNFGTDPFNADTDGGGIDDGAEVAQGTDPTDPLDDSPFNTAVCGEPTFATFADRATFIWKDCAGNGGWSLRSSGGGANGRLDFNGRVLSPGGLVNLTEVNIEAADTLDDTTVPDQLFYNFVIYNNGVDGIDFVPNAGACFVPNLADGYPVYIGVGRALLTGNDLSLDSGFDCPPALDSDGDGLSDSDETTIHFTDPNNPDSDGGGVQDGAEVTAGTNPNDPNDDSAGNAVACGSPLFDPAVDRGAFLWKDCLTNVWHAEFGAGGGTSVTYSGRVDAPADLVRVTPMGLEQPEDSFDSITDPTHVEYSFELLNADADTFEFELAIDAGTCFVIESPTLAPVFIGQNRQQQDGPFDLGTLGNCDDGPPPSVPNIVVLFTDDQRFDTLQHMPTVASRLAPIGVEFTNAYVPTPLCCPARASTYSGGYYAQNTGILENGDPNGGRNEYDDSVNLGTVLQGADYRTMFVGKWMNDYVLQAPRVPPGWNNFVGRSVYASGTDWSQFRYLIGGSTALQGIGNEVDASGTYHAYFERDQIQNFIQTTPGSKPFFVFWATSAPHSPATPDAQDVNAFDTFEFRGGGYNEADLSDKPLWVRNFNPANVKFSGDEAVRDQLRSMLAVDRGLGAIVDTIEALGRMENTVFILTSDNGYMWGEHRLWGKNYSYEESIKVPFLVVKPGVPARTEDKLVSAVLDLGPTVYDLAGVPQPGGDGTSLLPLLEDTNVPWRSELFFEKYSRAFWSNALWVALRQGDMKFVQYWDEAEELYDLANDPFELDNLADNPAYASVLLSMRTRALELRGLAIKPLRLFPQGNVDVPYNHQFETWGGLAPFSWSLNSGELPPGLVLDPVHGTLSGTPTTEGEYQFTVRVTGSGIATQKQTPRTWVGNEITLAVGPPVPTLFVDSQSVAEDAGVATFNISVTPLSPVAVSVTVNTVDGTAVAGEDYTAVSQTVTIPPNTAGTTVSVPIASDLVNEPQESFSVLLSNPTGGAALGITTGTGTIENDDVGSALSIDSVSLGEASGPVNFTITVNPVSADALTVDVATADDSALAAQDYVAFAATINIPAGASSVTVPVALIDDGLAEPSESFTATLTNPTGGAVIDTAVGVATINDDEGAPVVSIDSVAIAENSGPIGFTISISPQVAVPVDVDVLTVAGTATAGEDFTPVAMTVTIPPNAVDIPLGIILAEDDIFEPDESFTVELSNPTAGAVLGATAIGTGTIENDDAAPELSISSVSLAEAGGAVDFTISVSPISAIPLTVDVATSDGTAVAPADYVAYSDTITIPAGIGSVLVPISPVDDGIAEGSEIFTLTLSNPSAGASLGAAIGSGTILDDEGATVVSIDSVNVAEGPDPAVFTISIAPVSGQPFTVDVATGDGSAVAGSDYMAETTVLTIPEGAAVVTFPVAVLNDALAEPIETFSVTLANPSAGAVIGTGVGVGTISDDDGMPTVSINSVSLSEDTGPALLTVSVVPLSATPITLDLLTTDNSAVAPDDFEALATTITIPAGTASVTLPVTIAADSLFEADEDFSVTLSNAPVGVALGVATGTVTIENDDQAPTISIDSVAVAENAGPVGFTISIEPQSPVPVDVFVTTVDGTALAGDDYTPVALTVTIPPAVSSIPLGIVLTEDDIFEADETFTVELSAPTGDAVLGAATVGTATIENDDAPPELSIDSVSLAEAGGTGDFTISVSPVSVTAITVDVATADDTASAGIDYTAVSQTITIPAGAATFTVPVTVADDAIAEGSETFTLTLSNPDAGATLGTAIGTATILDDEGASALAIDSISVAEGPAAALFTISIAPVSSQPLAVDVATVDGSALAGVDYLAQSTTLTVPAGAATLPVPIALIDDALAEPSETFSVTLANASGGAVITTASGLATINDDDGVPTVSVDSASAAEDAGVLVFTLSVLPLSATAITVDAATGAGTAVSPGDFEALLTTLTIPAGTASVTVPVTLVSDSLLEADESFTLTLSNPSAGSALGTAIGTGIIENDDLAPTLAIDSLSVAEGAGAADFTISVNPSSASPLTVEVATSNGSAEAGSDYTAVSTTVAIPAGAVSVPVTVVIADDTLSEADETFTVTLSNPSAPAILGAAIGTGTIVNDDVALLCGAPSYNPATDKGIYISKQCSDGRWRVEAVGGGSYSNFIGEITSVQPLTNLQPVSIEATDDINLNTDPQVLDYSMKVAGRGTDAIVFAATPGASNCFVLSAPANVGIFAGPSGMPMPSTFDLDTLGACGSGGQPFVSIADASVDEGGGTMVFNLSLSAASTDAVSVDVTSTNGSAQAPTDFDAVDTTVTFSSGQTSQTLSVPVTDDVEAEGSESFQLTLGNPLNAALGTSTATGTIVDNDGISCGAPSFNPAQDRGLFVWQSCSTGRWNVQAAVAGTYTQYTGFVSSPQNFFGLRGIGLEASDTLTNSNPRVINYALKVAGSGLDAFEFGYSEPAGACFTLSAPGNVDVFHGPDKQVRTGSFDLATGGACN